MYKLHDYIELETGIEVLNGNVSILSYKEVEKHVFLFKSIVIAHNAF